MNNICEIYRSSLDAGAGLPGETYTSEAVFAEETKRLFRTSWLCIGLTSDVRVGGDIHPVRFAGIPLLVVRDKESKVRVYHNACAHRGTLLATEPRHCHGAIVCPYHSWAYDFDGRLVRTPHAGGAGKHDLPGGIRTTPRLVEVRSATWNGLLFINLSGTAASFEEFIAPVNDRIGTLREGSLRYDRDLSAEMTFRANWKLVVENFVESYHVPSIHPELEKLNPMRDHYQILGGHSYLGQGGHGYLGAREEGMAGLPIRDNADPGKYEVFYIYPNLIFGPVPNFGFVIIANPRSAEVTHERLEFGFYDEESMSPEYRPLRQANARFLQNVNRQDIEICKIVQEGRHSPAFTGGVFAFPQEKTSLHFLQMVAANMVRSDEQSPEDVVSLPTEDIFHATPALEQ